MDIDRRIRPTSERLALLALAAIAAPLTACVTDANKCVPGFVYDPAYDACLQESATVDGGSPSGDAGAASEGGGGDAAPSTEGGLGASCNSSSDCPSPATFCLKDPTAAPTDPGICTIPACTAAACGSAYSCCDCTAAVLSALMAWPKNVCAPQSNKSTLQQFGCSCQ